VPPAKQTSCPFGAEKFLADKVGEDLAAEEFSQSRIFNSGNIMEDARLIHAALGD